MYLYSNPINGKLTVMKHLFYTLFAVLTALFITSCSSSNDTVKTISPTRTGFESGEIAKYIEVVDEADTLTYAKNQLILKVKLKLTKKVDVIPEGTDSYDLNFKDGTFSVTLTDENGTELTTLLLNDEKEIKDLLVGKEGDEATVMFSTYGGKDDFEKAAGFKPDTTDSFSVGNSETSTDSLSTDTSGDSDSHPATTSASLTEALQDYADMVDKLSDMVDELGKGQVGLLDVQDLMEKAEKLSQKLDESKGELSEKDAEKLLELETKVLSLSAKITGKTAGALLGL